MAVLNYYTARTTMGPPALPPNAISAISGAKESALQNTVVVGNTDSTNSTYMLFQDVPFNAKFKDLLIENDALGGAGAISIGIFDPKTGVVVSAACLASALSVVSAHSKAPSAALDGLAALSHTGTQQCLWEIAGETFAVASKRGRYDIVVTLGAAGASGGNITGRATLTPAG